MNRVLLRISRAHHRGAPRTNALLWPDFNGVIALEDKEAYHD